MTDQFKKSPGQNNVPQAPSHPVNPPRNQPSAPPPPTGQNAPGAPPPPPAPGRLSGITNGDFFPPPPPPIQSSPPQIVPEPVPSSEGAIPLEPDSGPPPEIIPQGSAGMHQPPAAPYPPPPSVAPESDPNVISAVPLEIDPASVETAEIMHERKAESRHYMTPDMNDEKAVRTAMLKEIMGIREELETLNGWLEALVKKQG